MPRPRPPLRPRMPRTRLADAPRPRRVPPAGSDYSAVWSDDSTLVLTVHEGAGSGWSLSPGTMRILPTAQIRSYAGASDPADYTVDLTAQTFGKPGAPELVSAIVSDDDNFNTAWSGGDVIALSFDRATDHGKRRRSGGRAYVDELFAFDHLLGEDCALAKPTCPPVARPTLLRRLARRPFAAPVAPPPRGASNRRAACGHARAAPPVVMRAPRRSARTRARSRAPSCAASHAQTRGRGPTTRRSRSSPARSTFAGRPSACRRCRARGRSSTLLRRRRAVGGRQSYRARLAARWHRACSRLSPRMTCPPPTGRRPAI